VADVVEDAVAVVQAEQEGCDRLDLEVPAVSTDGRRRRCGDA